MSLNISAKSIYEETMITGIGSFPFTSVDETIDLIFSTCKGIPFWPQLPKRSLLENMYTTFLEGVPCIVSDEEKNTIFMDTEGTDGIEEFYENVASDNVGAFAVSERYAPGFYRFLERLREIEDGLQFIKCQVTGPFSMGLGLKDEKDKPVIYNFAFYDIIKKALHMKAKWMIKTIQSAYPGVDIIIFFDEPYMVSFGSAYISIPREEVIASLNEVVEDLPARRGIHVCGNTDWSVPFQSDIDIVNYDAFSYLDTVFYFNEDLKEFLDRGGWIAPGVVPSSPEVMQETPDTVRDRAASFVEKIASVTAPDMDSILFTTSCGLGSLTEEEARRAMELLRQIAYGE
jgi:methionine synthase II (cobalamin-independent)